MHEELLTVAQAAQREGMSRATLYTAISQGRLPAQRVLGKLGLRLEDVQAWRARERKGRRKGTPMSEEGKARISAGQKQRWAQRQE